MTGTMIQGTGIKGEKIYLEKQNKILRTREMNRIKFRVGRGLLVSVFFVSLINATVDTRLSHVSNEYNIPSPGRGTLVIAVDARSNSGSNVSINSIQNAFQLDANMRGQNPTVSFSGEAQKLFPSTAYNTTEAYRPFDGRVSYTYTFNGGTRGVVGTSWMEVIRVSIEYDMGDFQTTISWFDGLPNYLVTDDNENEVWGSEEPIPQNLTDVFLPIELSTFSATGGNGNVTLSWSTSSELHNLGFEVYRSDEEEGEYNIIASYENDQRLEGAGNSNKQNEYHYYDKNIVAGQTYWYKLADVDFNGNKTFHGPISASRELGEKEISSLSPDIPSNYKLYQNYPNPFNPETTLRFDIPRLSTGESNVQILIYNSLGQIVNNLFQGELTAGTFEIKWDGKTDTGNHVPSGIYYARLRLDHFSKTIKLMLVR